MTIVSGRLSRAQVTAGLQLLVMAAAYYLSARIGLQLALVRGQVTPLWPPTGIGLACLLLFGIRRWPGITLGAFVTNVTLGPSLPGVIAISLGNTLAPVIAWLLLRQVGFRIELDRLRDALALVFLGAFGGMLISGLMGTATLVVTGAVPASRFASTLSVWWTGDAMGVLVVTPVLLVLSRVRWRSPASVPVVRWLEAVTLLVVSVGIMAVVTQSEAPMLFLVMPLVIWAALRFQHLGAAPCALLVSIIVVRTAAAGIGPFAGLSLVSTMVTLQAFNGSVALTALLLAAITHERNEAQRAVERAVTQLSEAVTTLEPYRMLRDGLLDNVLGERRIG